MSRGEASPLRSSPPPGPAIYKQYHLLRERTPVLRVPGSGERPTYSIARYKDVASAMRDSRLSKINVVDDSRINSRATRDPSFERLSKILLGRQNMLRSDPPAHTRLRRLVSDAFARREVRELEGVIQQVIQRLADQIEPDQPFDVIAGFAAPIPALVIFELMGIPDQDLAELLQWSDLASALADGIDSVPDPRSVLRAVERLDTYFSTLIAKRRAVPGGDLISAMIHAQAEDQRLTTDEILTTALLILVAGHITTTNLVGNGLYTLAHHPIASSQLRQQPMLMPGAVEEMLRLESPVQIAGYTTKQDIEVGGVHIPQDARLALLIGSANRDAEVFPQAEVFDIQRTPNRHLCFGGGIHLCLGAALARAEARIAFQEILRRFRIMTLVPEPPAWRHSTTLRGFATLPMVFSK